MNYLGTQPCIYMYYVFSYDCLTFIRYLFPQALQKNLCLGPDPSLLSIHRKKKVGFHRDACCPTYFFCDIPNRNEQGWDLAGLFGWFTDHSGLFFDSDMHLTNRPKTVSYPGCKRTSLTHPQKRRRPVSLPRLLILLQQS